MTVKILIKRRIMPDVGDGVDYLIMKLRGLVSQQLGYISGESFKRLDEDNIIMVISTWKGIEYWQKWANTPERKEIEDEIAVMLRAPSEIEVYEHI